MLYFASEQNKDLFIDFSDDINIQYEKDNNFSYYIENKRREFDHLHFLVLDLEFLSDTEDELIESVEKVKMLNKSSLQIVIVALNKTPGDTYLGKLFEKEIFNIITDKKEVIDCITRSRRNSFETAMKYKVDFTELQEETIEKSNIFKNVFLNKTKENKKTTFFKRSKTETNMLENKYTSIDKVIEKPTDLENQLVEESKRESRLNVIQEKQVDICSKEKLKESLYDIFNNTNFLKEEYKKTRDKIALEEICDGISCLFYYNNKVGILDENSNICMVYSLFEKGDIKDFLARRSIKAIFDESVYSKIKELDNKSNI